MRKKYPSDVSDKQWKIISSFFEPARPTGGRPRMHPARVLLNAILYLLSNGCRWEAMPGDFPPWKTVYSQYTRWTTDGTLERAMRALAPSFAKKLTARTSADQQPPWLTRLLSSPPTDAKAPE